MDALRISISISAARRDYLARWEDLSVKTFIIEDAQSREPIGMATLYDFRNNGCELGIKIGPQALRGRGYASEAVELLTNYAFETLNLERMRGSTLSHNYRMQRVFEKNGFEEVGDGTLLSRYDNRRYTELVLRTPPERLISPCYHEEPNRFRPNKRNSAPPPTAPTSPDRNLAQPWWSLDKRLN